MAVGVQDLREVVAALREVPGLPTPADVLTIHHVGEKALLRDVALPRADLPGIAPRGAAGFPDLVFLPELHHDFPMLAVDECVLFEGDDIGARLNAGHQ